MLRQAARRSQSYLLKRWSQPHLALASTAASAPRPRTTTASSRGDEATRPRASNPTRFQTFHKNRPATSQRKQRWQPQKKRTRKSTVAQTRPLPTSSWVQILNIPPMSSLDDMLNSLQSVLDKEDERGIVDLDAEWDPTTGKPLPLIHVDPSEPWVRSARLVLSSRGRPAGWNIQFQNRSIVHALLEHSRENQLLCAWKPVLVKEWTEKSETAEKPPFEVSDSMIRVENTHQDMTVDHVRHLFRRYDMTWDGPSVISLKYTETVNSLFVVHFRDPSWARAAVRELQGIVVKGRELRLAQYPRQIMLEGDEPADRN